MPKSLRAATLVLRTAFRADPLRAVLVLTLTPANGLGTALYGLWLKILVDGVLAGRLRVSLAAAAALATFLTAQHLLAILLAKLRFSLQERTGLALDCQLLGLVGGLTGLEHHERPEYLDRLELLRGERAELGQVLGAVVMNVTSAAQLLGAVILLGRLHAALLAVPVLGLASLAARTKAEALAVEAEEAAAAQSRLARHYFAMATTPSLAKEVRIFGFGAELVLRHRDALEAVRRARVRGRLVGAVWEGAGSLVSFVGYVGAIGLVVLRATRGSSTPGDVVLAVTLIEQVNGHTLGMAQMAGWLRHALRVAARLVALVDDAARARRSTGNRSAPERLASGIVLDGVGFRYPGTPTDVLQDVSMVLPAGSVVALVGENGAGKSTLVKLISRLYEPTSGRITVDGIDLGEIGVESWRSKLSAAFQDFCRLELTAQQAIGVGDLERVEDAPTVRRALRSAGAESVLDVLPEGLQTQLGCRFDGAELSLGQWQKVALARCRMREQPLVLLLDEPTASLDPVAEAALFERIAASIGRARAQGVITLLVSHRFSTVRMADLIVVLDGGRVVETGRHDALVVGGGLYAELFALQSRAYR